jgi:hypothetical protein
LVGVCRAVVTGSQVAFDIAVFWVDHDTLEDDLTIEDPKAYTKPWSGQLIFQLKPQWKLMEMSCEDNVTFLDLEQKIQSK